MIDRPIVERFFNTFSAVAGSVTAWVCARFYEPGGGWADVMLALLIPFLVIFAVTGAWRVLTLPTMTCRVDSTTRNVQLKQRAPLRRRDRNWRFEDIADIRAGDRPGDESTARLLLVLRDGRRVALSQDDTDRETVQRIVSEARRIMTTA